MTTTSPIPAARTPHGVGGGAGNSGASRNFRMSPGLKRLLVVRGVAPFAVYTVLFLGVPVVAIVLGAFADPHGGFTFSNVHTAATGVYRKGFEKSIELSVITAIVPAVVGLVVAYAVHKGGGLLQRLVATASGVFANFGGVPLAFLFIATVGSRGGLGTQWLQDIGINLYGDGFNLYAFSGVALVYMYFQIPLMVLVITPALGGLRPSWREAADNLGASGFRYWLHIAGPVLLPSFLGSVLLLFGSAFSAYATAEALTSGSIALTSIQIGSFLNGNVISGQENVGKALGFGMVVVIAAVMVAYVVLQRRASRWLR
jgi:putative spermidine/putrescine transport system permease protein